MNHPPKVSNTPPPVTVEMMRAGRMATAEKLIDEDLEAIYLAMHAARSNQEATPDDTESVARAIRGRQAGYDDWDGLTEHQQDAYRSDADAAIAAMTAAKPVQEATRTVGPIMLEIAQATREAEMWERRFQSLVRMFEPDKRFVDRDGKWGLRDFLDYAAPICGFTSSPDTND